MVERRIEKGLNTPFWDNRPILEPHLQEYYNIFFTLSNCRGSGVNGAEALKITEIEAFYRFNGLRNNAEKFLTFIMALDQEFLKFFREKREKNKG